MSAQRWRRAAIAVCMEALALAALADEPSNVDCVAAAGSVAPMPGEVKEAAQRWALAEAIPISASGSAGQPEGLGFLHEFVGNARVVALGEPMHRAHESLVLRNRMFAYLVEHLRFTAIALETDFVDGAAIDDYVTGHGELTDELVAGVFSFSAPHAATENRQLLEWMRAFNSRPGHVRKVHFYGLEMMGRSLDHPSPIPSRPLDAALRYLASVDPQQGAIYRERVQPVLAAWASQARARKVGKISPYEGLSLEQRDAYTLTIADLIALFERRAAQWIAQTSLVAYERGLRSLLNARALDADFRANGWWLRCSTPSKACDPDQRDAMSAQNLTWALQKEGPHGRVALFAHNTHIRRGAVRNSLGQLEFTSLGQHLDAVLRHDLVVIGAFFGTTRGFPQPNVAWYDGLSGVLDSTARPAFALNLRALPATGPAAEWWNSEIADSRCRSLRPTTVFDAVVFLSVGTPWQARASINASG